MSQEIERPDPDHLLALAKEEQIQKSRGKLKIFLGYAAGVGKTFAMLEAAHQRKDHGVNVAIGYIETHGRKETEALLDGLEIIPRVHSVYRNTSLTEMDLDGILTRHPQLVLVDELAHTNVPSSRHPKRYQDVEELLSAGIDVYTTVNIQHFESMNDIVRQITGVIVRETIPDRIMDEASEIEVIDLPPDELLQRLSEGKVYVPEQASRAVHEFFRKGNLTALREISLRRAAERVDNQMRSYMRTKAISGPWPAGDRILVCVSSHPMCERLIRTGRRLSDDLDAEWIVAFVETPGHANMPAENRTRIMHAINLAEQMGARVEYLSGTSVAETILDFARRHNITKIVAGKPLRPQWYELLRGGSVVDQIIRKSSIIDVYVISEEPLPGISQPQPKIQPGLHWARYLKSMLLVAFVTFFSFPAFGRLESTNLVMFYLAAVVISAVYLGKGPSILASLLSVLAFDYFFVHPRFSFAVSDTEYILTFIALMGVGLVISSSASLLRDQVDQLKVREVNARTLNSLGKELTAAVNLDDVLGVVTRKLRHTFECNVVICLPQGNDLNIQVATEGMDLDQKEKAIALWVFRNNAQAGRGTETLPVSSIRFLPLKTSQGVVGVLGIQLPGQEHFLSPEVRLLLDNFSNLAALAIERALFAEKAGQAESLRATERLQSALLNSISHELRTPLASIMGALSSLEEDECSPSNKKSLNHETRIELIKSATAQTGQLNHLVGNLLDMTRLQSGAVKLHRTPIDVEDLVGAILSQLEGQTRDRPKEIRIPGDFPSFVLDAILIGQVLVNLLDNALKFSPPGSPIAIHAWQKDNELHLSVQDQGPGVAAEELEKVFEKFFRGSTSANYRGTGLGLSICRGIIEAHGGRIWAENVPGGGFKVEFAIPVETENANDGDVK